MDDRSFDRLARLLGEARDRRTGLKALVGGIIGAGGLAALDDAADAKRRGKDRDKNRRGDDGPDADRRKKKRRKKCVPPCGTGFACVKGACTCASGVTCGTACCASGQRCEDGACTDRPEPDACIAFGQPCKNAGRPCCDGLSCASGQDGSYPVACYRAKTAACERTADCAYGTACVGGVCVGSSGGGVPTGAPCTAGANCDQPGAICTAYTTPGAPSGDFCTLPLRRVCSGDPDCTCYKCWYVNGGAEGTGRTGRASTNVKACCHPPGQPCATDNDCCSGLECRGNVCDGGPMCVPEGGASADGPCCVGLTVQDGVCTGGGPTCGVFGDSCASTACCDGLTCGSGTTCTRTCTVYPTDANQPTKTPYELLLDALTAAQDDPGNAAKNPVYVAPGTYGFPGVSGQSLQILSKSTTHAVKIFACDPGNRPVFDGQQPWTTHVADTTRIPDGSEWAPLGFNSGYGILDFRAGASAGECGATDSDSCAGFEVDGIDFRNASSTRSGSGAGAMAARVRLKVSNATITRCKGPTGGIEAGSLGLENVTIRQCFANTYQTAAGAVLTDEPGSWTNLTIEYNGAFSNGVGGIKIRSSSPITLTDATIRYNSPGGVETDSAASVVTCAGTTTISDNTPGNCTRERSTVAASFSASCNCNPAPCVLPDRTCGQDSDCCVGTCQSLTDFVNFKVCCVNNVCKNRCCANAGACNATTGDCP